MPKGCYTRTEPHGFLKPWHWHKVVVSKIGTVYEGRNARDARQTFNRWTNLSGETIGRAAGQIVTYTIDGQPHQTNQATAQ